MSCGLQVPLTIAKPLDVSLLNGHQLGLAGEHQLINAGLAVSLCHTWIHKMGQGGKFDLKDSVRFDFLDLLCGIHLGY